MKKKFTKILGISLTVVLLASLMSFAVPVSAATLLWYTENPPSTTGNVLGPSGIDINDLAANGDTLYAATNDAYLGLVKSTDTGATWTSLKTSTSYPTGYDIIQVAVAPDDANQIIMLAKSGTTYRVYYSSNGGSSWSNLGTPTTTAIPSSIIFDVDISPAAAGVYYVAAGANTTSSAGEMYTIKLATAESWTARSAMPDSASTNFTAQEAVLAVKFSPNFATDKIITCITGDVTSTAAAYFQVFRYESGAYTWNNAITYYTGDGYAQGVSIDTLTAAATKASITLSPDYLGTEEQERIGFVGLAAGTSDGGAYRVNDSYVKELTTWSGGDEGPIYSVAYHEDGKLIAGDSNDSQVYYCLDPMATSPKFERVTSYKQPGGVNSVVVDWAGDIIVAGTSGDESAIAVSTNDGLSFNDISLIDTTLSNITDVATSPDGSIVYLASYDNESAGSRDASIWVKDTSWKRVLSLRDRTSGQESAIIRVAPDNGEVVYVGYKGSQDFYMSKGAGKVSWKYVPCYKLTASGYLKDFVVEDSDVAYALDADGVSKTTNAGASWGTRKPMDGISGFMITLATNGDVLIGGSDGKVAWSTDGGSTFTASEKQVGDTSGNVRIVADPDYEENSIIYATNAGESTPKLRRAKTTKTTTFSDRGPTLTSSDSVYGMVAANGLIYVLTHNGSDSKLWRNMDDLATADTAALALWSGRSTSYDLTASAPQGLKVSDGPKFWGVSSSDLYSITDPLAVNGPTLTTPANAVTVDMNPAQGRAYAVTFGFKRNPDNSYITKMQLQIATDSTFDGIILDKADITIDTESKAVTVGPYAQTGYDVELVPGRTYYWRVRVAVDGPMYSLWSEVRSFKIEAAAVALELLAPDPGAKDVGMTPTFSWSPVEGAIAYEFEIAKDAAFTVPGWKVMGDGTAPTTNAYLSEHELEYDTTYFWRVRPVFAWAKKPAPQQSGEWVTGVFTTISEPAAPPAEKYVCPQCGLVFETQQELADHWAKYHPPAPAPAPAIPTYMLWTIVIIGAVLFIALIVLIVRTRRVV